MTLGLVLVLAVLTFTLLTSTCYQQYTLTGPYAREYEGKILENEAITASQRVRAASRPFSKAGRRKIRSRPGEENYERAQKGWIRRRSGVELRAATRLKFCAGIST